MLRASKWICALLTALVWVAFGANARADRPKNSSNADPEPECLETVGDADLRLHQLKVVRSGSAAEYTVDFEYERPYKTWKSCLDGWDTDPVSFSIGIWHHRTKPPVCGATPDVVIDVPDFKPENSGGNVWSGSVSKTVRRVPDGAGAAWAMVDPTCSAKDKDVVNNFSAEAPELTVEAKGSKRRGSSVEQRFTLCNEGGPTTVKTVKLAFASGEATTATQPGSWDQVRAETLPKAQQCRDVKWLFRAPAHGTFKGFVAVDHGNALGESVEDNNVASFTYSVVDATAQRGRRGGKDRRARRRARRDAKQARGRRGGKRGRGSRGNRRGKRGRGSRGTAPPPRGRGGRGTSPPPRGRGGRGTAPPPRGKGGRGGSPPPQGEGGQGDSTPPQGEGGQGSGPE